MKNHVTASVMVGSGIVGGVLGGVLSKYWWDFPEGDVETYGAYIVPFYATLGACLGLGAGACLLGLAAAVSMARERRAGERPAG